MKTKLFMFAAIFCCIMLTQSFTAVSRTETNKASEKIELEQHTKNTTRSATATNVTAFGNDVLLSVEVTDYTGNVQVEVTGYGGFQYQMGQINNAGLLVVDVSALPKGVYTVCITLENAVYAGTFEK